MAPVLELKSITKEYAGHRVVDDVTLALEPGEFFALVGPSGCGKTTTLRMIAGFEQPSDGEIRLKGQLLSGVPAHLRDVTTVFQNYALFPHLSAAKNIAFGLERRNGRSAEYIRRRVREMIDLLELTGKEDRRPAQLSGGEKQRVAVARALIVEPAVLLLDEPLSALDPNLRKHVRSELRSLQQRLGTTFLFVTHDQEEALAMSDRMGVMNRGRLEQTGAAADLYTNPASKFVAEFLGDVNWIRDGRGIRPQHVRLERKAVNNGTRCLSAVVADQQFLGSRWQIQVQMEERTWKCETNCGFVRGDTVFACWSGDDEICC